MHNEAFLIFLTTLLCGTAFAQRIPMHSATGQAETVRTDMAEGGNPYGQTGFSIDTDIRLLRNNALPEFTYKCDDYIQYSPAVLMIGLKVFGYKGRSSWGRMLVSDAFSGMIMAGAVNGIKYSVRRMRPDGSSFNSFPSGHTAKAFMAATMLHKEYGWRSPWFSIGGYVLASATGISRIMNDSHWMSDVVAGGAIGIGSVHLGYFLSDLIFKERHLHDGYEKPDIFAYDFEHRYYEAGISFARRFTLGAVSDKDSGILPHRGSTAAFIVHIPIVPRTGIAVRAAANELGFKSSGNSDIAESGGTPEANGTPANANFSFNMYNVLAGAFWQYPFPKLLEFEIKAMLGYAWHKTGNGIDILAGAAAVLRTGENFRIKAFAEYETFSFSRQKPYVNSFLLGFSTSFCW